MIDRLYEIIESANLWSDVKTLNRGDILKQQNSTDLNLYFVVDGNLRAFVNENDEDITIRLAYKNNFFSAVDSFISEKPSSITIQALKSTKYQYVKKEDLKMLLMKSSDFNEIWLQLLEQLIVQLMERELDILISSPQERLNKVLSRSPQLFQEVPHKYIASYLRMTPETLSRILKS